MTTRNFDALFRPRSVVLVGASNQAGSVGAVLARNLFGGGFSGPVMTVNPHERAIRSTLNYRSISELPLDPDLAVVATPAPTVPQVIRELGDRGCRAAVVISAGFDAALRQEMLDAARPHLMRILGPNCLGYISPGIGLNASFAHVAPMSGDIAFLSQSGAVATAIIDWAVGRRIGFSHLVSLGDMSDIDFGDLMDHLAADPATRSILLYLETATSPRKFLSAGRIASRAKPVIVVKGGRSTAGAKAAHSHTGALAGADAVYDAAFRRAGMLRVFELRELFDAAATLASGARVNGERLTILTNGGGLGVLAADALELRGGRLSQLSEPALAALGKALPHGWSKSNPVDILGDAGASRYEAALDALLQEREQDALLVMNCPTGVADSVAPVGAVLEASRRSSVPVLTAWVGEATAGEARRRLSQGGVPAYETPDEAVTAFMHLVDHHRNQAALLEAPAAGVLIPRAERGRAHGIVAAALAEGRSLLTEPEAKAVLEAFQIPVVETLTASDPAEAGRLARQLGGPVVLKILSRAITHKSDVGGVHLDLRPDAVEQAAVEMQARVAAAAPAAQLDGFTVQSMVRRPRAHELIAGVAEDPTFGPVLLFGQGGVAVEVLADRAIGLPPLSVGLAREMIDHTRVSRLLAGYRDRPKADLDAIADTLVKLSELVVWLPEVVELDINPLLADEKGVLALDARIVVRQTAAGASERLTICPYPAHFERETSLADAGRLTVRPIRPEDAGRLVDLADRITADDLRNALFATRDLISASQALRLTQIDYDREMTFVAVEPNGDFAGAGRLLSDPNFDAAEFTVVVRSDLQGRGVGHLLLTAMLDYARVRGLRRVWGDVQFSNGTMLEMARRLGADIHRPEPDGETLRIDFDLSHPPAT